MPYIKQEYRGEIDELVDKLADEIRYGYSITLKGGVLNYAITRMMTRIFDEPGYFEWSQVITTLECCKLEFYRRAMAPYEDDKANENGDVY